MYPNPTKRGEKDFYSTHERILYEGSHILDLVCWLLDAEPQRVFMTGDRLVNNCCILDFAEGSQVSFMCGSMGSYLLGSAVRSTKAVIVAMLSMAKNVTRRAR